MQIVLRSQLGYDTDAVSNETALECNDPSLAQQHQKDEADINTIVKRFGLTGQLPENVRMPSYGDFTDVTDYQTAMNAVLAANKSFMAMPADVRARFNNDPALFVDFCSNPENIDEAVKLGLAVKKQTAPDGGAAVTPAQSPAPEGA